MNFTIRFVKAILLVLFLNKYISIFNFAFKILQIAYRIYFKGISEIRTLNILKMIENFICMEMRTRNISLFPSFAQVAPANNEVSIGKVCLYNFLANIQSYMTFQANMNCSNQFTKCLQICMSTALVLLFSYLAFQSFSKYLQKRTLHVR